MLVYEYISNSSLDKWFYENNLLDWDWEMCIIIGVAQGLSHLHKCHPIIVHLDIKPQNILLDKDYTPKLLILGWQKFQMARMKMWYVPHQSFFNWLCACTLYLSVIMNLANLNTLARHNLLISYLHYYRSWNEYDKHSHSKMNIWKILIVIIHEITFYITNFLFMCA